MFIAGINRESEGSGGGISSLFFLVRKFADCWVYKVFSVVARRAVYRVLLRLEMADNGETLSLRLAEWSCKAGRK